MQYTDNILISGSWIDRSGKVTTGGTSQVVMANNPIRRRLLIQNPVSVTSEGIGATENLFVNFSSPASSTLGNSIELIPGGSYDTENGMCPTDQVTIVAATSGHQFLAKEMI